MLESQTRSNLGRYTLSESGAQALTWWKLWKKNSCIPIRISSTSAAGGCVVRIRWLSILTSSPLWLCVNRGVGAVGATWTHPHINRISASAFTLGGDAFAHAWPAHLSHSDPLHNWAGRGRGTSRSCRCRCLRSRTDPTGSRPHLRRRAGGMKLPAGCRLKRLCSAGDKKAACVLSLTCAGH